MGYNFSCILHFDVNEFFDKSEASAEDVVSAISTFKKIYAHKRTLRKTDKFFAYSDTHLIPEKYFDKNTEKYLQILADFLSKIDEKQKYYYGLDSTNEAFYELSRTKFFNKIGLKGTLLTDLMILYENNYLIYNNVSLNPNYFLAISEEGECNAINVCSVLETLFDCEIRDEIQLAIELF